MEYSLKCVSLSPWSRCAFSGEGGLGRERLFLAVAELARALDKGGGMRVEGGGWQVGSVARGGQERSVGSRCFLSLLSLLACLTG